MINFINCTCFYIDGQYSCHKKVCCTAKSVVCPKKGIDRLSRASLLSVVRPLVEVKGTAISSILFAVYVLKLTTDMNTANENF